MKIGYVVFWCWEFAGTLDKVCCPGAWSDYFWSRFSDHGFFGILSMYDGRWKVALC